MRTIPIEAIANQQFSVRLDNALYDITIKETRGVMSVTIARDDVVLIANSRVTAGTPLLPYQYDEIGNFVMLVEDEELPYWTNFGITQQLIYVTAAEVEGYRG